MNKRGWQDEIIKEWPSGVDVHQIDQWLRLTPTERLEKMREFLESLERAKTGHGDRLSETS